MSDFGDVSLMLLYTEDLIENFRMDSENQNGFTVAQEG